MISVIHGVDRNCGEYGWLTTYRLFSFSDYYDPANENWGMLRVFNDDVVQAGEGFPEHPHKDMEIVTIVLDGELTHRDSTGNSGVIRPGDVQRMSAGTGIRHSEYNLGKVPVHFYQIWIYPGVNSLKPSYEQNTFDPAKWHNTILPLASGQGMRNVVKFNSNATIYRCALDAGKTVLFQARDSRFVFVYMKSGSVAVNGTVVGENGQARIKDETILEFKAAKHSDFIIIDVPEDDSVSIRH